MSTYGGRSPRRSHPDNFCPVAEVAPAPGNGSVTEEMRGVVLVEGEEEEDYSHVIKTEPATSTGEGKTLTVAILASTISFLLYTECLPAAAAASSSTLTPSSSSDQSSDRTTLNPVDNRPLLEPEIGHFKKVCQQLHHLQMYLTLVFLF